MNFYKKLKALSLKLDNKIKEELEKKKNIKASLGGGGNYQPTGPPTSPTGRQAGQAGKVIYQNQKRA